MDLDRESSKLLPYQNETESNRFIIISISEQQKGIEYKHWEENL